jgi:PEGA domain
VTLFGLHVTLFAVHVTLPVTLRTASCTHPDSPAEVTVELPFTIVFEPPSQKELRAILRMRGIWVAGLIVALAIGTLLVLSGVGRADAVASTSPAPLELTSRPIDAQVWLDGREAGRTPLSVLVEPGVHSVLLKAADALDGQYTLQVGSDGAAFDVGLLRRHPTLIRLRPTLPGAALADVRLLSDGQLALSMRVPPGKQIQAWRMDPASGVVEALLTEASGTRVAFAADGEHVAYTGYEVGPTPSPTESSMLWLVDRGRAVPTAGWRAPLTDGERLLDASWSPRDDRLLVVSSRPHPGGTVRSRAWFVDADGQRAREVLSLPSDVVPGSAVWSPDGAHVVFLAHAGVVNALCVLDLEGGFRYVADLDPSPGPPLAYPPASWSTDSQRLVFVAPHQHPAGVSVGWLQQPEAPHALYVANVSEAASVPAGDTPLDFAAWREDGQLLGLGRLGNGGALDLRLVNAAGSGQHLLELPFKPGSGYGVAWDIGRRRLLVANSSPSGGIDYWLALLGVESAA